MHHCVQHYVSDGASLFGVRENIIPNYCVGLTIKYIVLVGVRLCWESACEVDTKVVSRFGGNGFDLCIEMWISLGVVANIFGLWFFFIREVFTLNWCVVYLFPFIGLLCRNQQYRILYVKNPTMVASNLYMYLYKLLRGHMI